MYNDDSHTMYNNFQENLEKHKRKQRHKNIISNWVLSIVCGIIAFIPLWFFLFVQTLLSPEGFWQKFVLYGVGLYFLGSLQLLFLFIYLGILINVIWKY